MSRFLIGTGLLGGIYFFINTLFESTISRINDWILDRIISDAGLWDIITHYWMSACLPPVSLLLIYATLHFYKWRQRRSKIYTLFYKNGKEAFGAIRVIAKDLRELMHRKGAALRFAESLYEYPLKEVENAVNHLHECLETPIPSTKKLYRAVGDFCMKYRKFVYLTRDASMLVEGFDLSKSGHYRIWDTSDKDFASDLFDLVHHPLFEGLKKEVKGTARGGFSESIALRTEAEKNQRSST